jgi:hypothetical protein
MNPSTAPLRGHGHAADRARGGGRCRIPLVAGCGRNGRLAFSQLVTLYIAPVVYTYYDALKRRFGRGAERAGPE